MKPTGSLKHFILAFVIALMLYATFYSGIEHRRTRNGPWQVTFTNDAGVPTLIVNEPKLHIANLRINFPGEPAAPTNSTMIFDQPQPVPFAVPFGQCAFMDTTFQPGTIVFDMFGHEIQLLPRVLTIDKKEHPWRSDTTISLKHEGGSSVPAKAQ
ncbi:MAG TPA: hypothetical protein VFC07_15765 [Verrucomicrobiae bacterium]|nr:hypothetical protein [Verrucomicrobiae bacterium]